MKLECYCARLKCTRLDSKLIFKNLTRTQKQIRRVCAQLLNLTRLAQLAFQDSPTAVQLMIGLVQDCKHLAIHISKIPMGCHIWLIVNRSSSYLFVCFFYIQNAKNMI